MKAKRYALVVGLQKGNPQLLLFDEGCTWDHEKRGDIWMYLIVRNKDSGLEAEIPAANIAFICPNMVLAKDPLAGVEGPDA